MSGNTCGHSRVIVKRYRSLKEVLPASDCWCDASPFRRQYLKLLLFFSSLPSPQASAILLFCRPRQRPVLLLFRQLEPCCQIRLRPRRLLLFLTGPLYVLPRHSPCNVARLRALPRSLPRVRFESSLPLPFFRRLISARPWTLAEPGLTHLCLLQLSDLETAVLRRLLRCPGPLLSLIP